MRSREDQREALDRDRDVLRGLQLVGVEDLDLSGIGRQLFGEAGADPDLVGEVGDQAAEVEADVAVFGRDRFFLFFEHFDQLFVGGPVGALPEALRGRGLEQLFGAVAGHLSQTARDAVRPAAWFRPGRMLFSSFSTLTFS